MCGEDVVDGYLEDEEATARRRRDSWFHPGDLAPLDEAGRLRVVGRTNDLLNVDGFQLMPSPVRGAVRGTGVVDNVALFQARASPPRVGRVMDRLRRCRAAVCGDAGTNHAGHPHPGGAGGDIPRNVQQG